VVEEGQTIHKEYEWECIECGYTSFITIEPDSVKALKDTHSRVGFCTLQKVTR
jgi:hypothetical protein